jgi:hypothetical protein
VGAWLLHEGAGNRCQNLATRQYGTITALPATGWQANPDGVVLFFAGGGGGNKLVNDNYAPLSSALRVSIVARVKTNSVSGNAGIIDQTGTGDATNLHWELLQESSLWKARTSTEGTSNADVAFTTIPSTSVWQTLGMSVIDNTASTGTKTYMNGVFETQGTSKLMGTGSGKLLIGHLGSAVYPFTGTIQHVYVWNRVLEANEFLWAHQEPYDFLAEEPIRRSFFFKALDEGVVVLGDTMQRGTAPLSVGTGGTRAGW